MLNISTSEVCIHIVFKIWLNREKISAIILMLNSNFSSISKKCSPSSKLSWNDTIAHIHSMFPDHEKVFWHSNTHYVSWFICWHKRSSVGNDALHMFRTFSNRNSANGVAWKIA